MKNFIKRGDIYIQKNKDKAMVIGILNDKRIKLIYLHNGIKFVSSNLKNEGFVLYEQFKNNPTLEEIKNRLKLIKKGYL